MSSCLGHIRSKRHGLCLRWEPNPVLKQLKAHTPCLEKSQPAIPYMIPLGLYIQLRLSGWHPHKMSVYSSIHGAGQPFVPHVHHANPSTYFNIGQFLCLLNQFPLVLQSSLLDLRFLQSLLRFLYHCASDSRRSVFWYMCGSPARLWGLGGKAYPHPRSP